MASGNGDERQMKAWDRVEAKLDRMGDDVNEIKARLGTVEDRVLVLQQRTDLVDRKLDVTRQALEAQIELSRLEIMQAIGAIARDHALGAQIPLQGRLDALDGKVDALTMRVEALERERR
jgi:tetrahydromethanopterin S-methyltransferase subunit G